MTKASYTSRTRHASTTSVTTIDQIVEWIGQQPGRVGSYAFLACRLLERDGLAYRLVFDRIVAAAMTAGRSEAAARRQVFRGFAACAAGWVEPPPELEDD